MDNLENNQNENEVLENATESQDIKATEDYVDVNTENVPPAVEEPTAKQEETTPPPVNIPPVSPYREFTYSGNGKVKKTNKGLTVFCIVLALIVALTGTLSIGYLLGVNIGDLSKNHRDVTLEAKPKSADELTEAEVYEKVNESIVGIRVYNDSEGYYDCSGVVYSDDGYIVSNDHIYSEVPEAKFKVYTYDGKEYDAVYVAGDQISDLSVLKVQNATLKAATFGDSEQLFCGEHVVAIGRPGNAREDSNITSGIISLPKRRTRSTTTSYSSNLIETDSAINPGSSGGALVNMFGQVVGITSSKLAGEMYDSVCYAIPTKTMKWVCEELIKEGKVVSRAKLGISYTEYDSVTSSIKKSGVIGLYIASVSNESDLYGKVNEGDIITHINGKEITSDTVVLDIIENSKAGDTVTLTVSKAGGGTEEYKAKLLANIGTSSYKTAKEAESEKAAEENSEDNSENGPSFNFPFGD